MPGISFFLSCFYKREELLFRLGIFVSGSSMAGAFGGLLATGLSKIPRWGVHESEIETWRNIFFFEGMFTLLIGLAAPFFMPNSPENCHFLTPRERLVAAERLAREHKGVCIPALSLNSLTYLRLTGLEREDYAQTHPHGYLQHPHHNLRPGILLRKCFRPINIPLYAHHSKRHGLHSNPSATPLCPPIRHGLRSINRHSLYK